MRLLRTLGFAIRETGQALDRLGCRLQGAEPFAEECECFGFGGGGGVVCSESVPRSGAALLVLGREGGAAGRARGGDARGTARGVPL